MAVMSDTASASATAAAVRPPSMRGPGEVTGERALALRFTGSTIDYFRLWIVNACLTLLTLGIFSAWAKVRKKRYLYSHTVLDGTPFQYLGQPIPILKGRIIAAGLFGLWYAGTHFFVEMLPVVLIIGFVLAPWVLVRSAAFNARYSAFRNITFRFAGTYWSAVKVLYGWGAVMLLTFGLGFSWWQQRIKRYLITRMSYGGVNGEFSATGRQFFRTYFVAGLVFFIAAFVLGGMAGFLAVKSAGRYEYFVISIVCVYALYVAAFAYVQARIANLVWNNTQLPPIKFRSTLRARDLLGLYVTNALAILASAGLLIPWATVRMLKYRLAHFTVSADGDVRGFEGSSRTDVQAAGAEVGEFFDFDMSL
jgi:uncharacterized membrane protein YjgN (DUF898 family)